MKTKHYNKLEKIELFNFSTPVLTCYKNKNQFLFYAQNSIISVLTKKEFIEFIEGKLTLSTEHNEDIVNYGNYSDVVKTDKNALLTFIG